MLVPIAMSQTHIDNRRKMEQDQRENLYRHGVLISNFVEDKFGSDLAQSRSIRTDFTTTAQRFHSQGSSLLNAELPEKKDPLAFQGESVKKEGVEQHLLFGHGPKQEQFQAKEFRTTYELSYDNKVPAHKSIEPHFLPPAPVPKPTAPSADLSAHPRQPKSYHEFTKRCDATFNKIGLRR